MTEKRCMRMLTLLDEQKGRHASESLWLWHCCTVIMYRKRFTLMMTSAASGAMQIVRLLPRRKGMMDSLSATA